NRLEQIGRAGLQPGLIGDDRAAPFADAVLESAKTRVTLQLLQPIALFPDLERLPHDGVEIDEDLGPEKGIDLLLASGVVDRERAELGPLVRGVVVDVKVRVARAEGADVVDEGLERRLLRLGVVCPRTGIAVA